MTSRHHVPRRFVAAARIVAVTAAVGAAAFAVGSASARTTTTLHLFAKSQASAMFNANGKPLSATATPKKGDYLIGIDVDYLGNYMTHGATPIGSDNAVCTFTSPTKGICDQEIAIGGSLLLTDHVSVNFAVANPVAKITGGTGKFKGARGEVIITPGVGNTNNSDFTVKYST
jgi:hypothetical protein